MNDPVKSSSGSDSRSGGEELLGYGAFFIGVAVLTGLAIVVRKCFPDALPWHWLRSHAPPVEPWQGWTALTGVILVGLRMVVLGFRARRIAARSARTSIDEFLASIRNKLPPAPAEQLLALERLLGYPLPDDYRRFLVACNGGVASGRPWFTGPTPDGSSADAGVHHIGGFRTEPYLSLTQVRDLYGPRIPQPLLWIMDDPFGNAICLGVAGACRGHVFFWDHENEPDPATWDGRLETAGNLQLLAHSFTDFVAGLRKNPPA
jgi:hypothetical protein